MDNHAQSFMFPSEFATSTEAPPPPFFAYPSMYSDAMGFGYMGSHMMGGSATMTTTFGSLHAEMIGKMSAQEILDAKALAASKSHSEAERRRRERINAHLARLRSLLPSTTKTDKASLLAEVIQHVKELKRQTSFAMGNENSPLLNIPTETDELTLDTSNENGKFVIKASLCCDDRTDLIPDLARALKSLKLRTLKAEITTVGGRIKNIVVVTAEEKEEEESVVKSIHDALRGVMERNVAEEGMVSASTSVKRQRTNGISMR